MNELSKTYEEDIDDTLTEKARHTRARRSNGGLKNVLAWTAMLAGAASCANSTPSLRRAEGEGQAASLHAHEIAPRESEPEIMLFSEAFQILESMHGESGQSETYLHFILGALAEELKEKSISIKNMRDIQRAYILLSEDARARASAYGLDRLIFCLDDASLRDFQKLTKEKSEKERLAKAKSNLEEYLRVRLSSITMNDRSDQIEIEFEHEGILVSAQIIKKGTDLGNGLFLQAVRVDSHTVNLGNLMVFDTRLGKVKQIAEAYKRFKAESIEPMKANPGLADRTIYYEPSNGQIFIESHSTEDPPQFKKSGLHYVDTAYEPYDSKYTFHRPTGAPYFRQKLPNNRAELRTQYDAGEFEIYDVAGKKIFSYKEWRDQTGNADNEKNRSHYIDAYLSPRLSTPELMTLFLDKMMRYTPDSSSTKNKPHRIDLLFKLENTDSFAIPEHWQPADSTIRRFERGAYLGDCDDYALLAVRLWKAQGKSNVHAVGIPEHATAITIGSDDSGRVQVEDIGTMSYSRFGGEDLAHALDAFLENYRASGLDIWRGNRLRLDPTTLYVLQAEHDEGTGENHMYTYVVSIDALTNQELLDEFFAIERSILDSKFEEGLARITEAKARYPEQILLEKLEAIALHHMGKKDQALEAFQRYLDRKGTATQEDFDMQLSLAGHDRIRAGGILEGMVDSLAQIDFDMIGGLRWFRDLAGKAEHDFIYKLKEKIAPLDRAAFLEYVMTNGSLSRDERIAMVREYIEAKLSNGGNESISSFLREAFEDLPENEQLTASIQLLAKYPDDPICNELLLGVLSRTQKTSLMVHLLERGFFDRGVSPQVKAILLSDAYFNWGEHARGLSMITAHIPQTRQEKGNIRRHSLHRTDNIYDALASAFRKHDRYGGEAYYRFHLETRTAQAVIAPKEFVRGWVETKYADRAMRTFKSVLADIAMLSGKQYTNVHRYRYFESLLKIYRYESEPGNTPILRLIHRSLKEIRTHLLTTYPDGGTLTEEESSDPSNEKNLRYGYMILNPNHKIIIDGTIEEAEKLLASEPSTSPLVR